MTRQLLFSSGACILPFQLQDFLTFNVYKSSLKTETVSGFAVCSEVEVENEANSTPIFLYQYFFFFRRMLVGNSRK